MAVKLLVNALARDAVQIKATDGSNVDLANQDTLFNIVGGARHLFYQPSLTGTVRACYINTNGISADTAILTNADNYAGKALKLINFSTYSSSSSNIYSSASFAETLIGARSQDWVYPFNQLTNQDAFVLEVAFGGSSINLGKVVFASTFTLSSPNMVEQVSVQPYWNQVVVAGRHYLTEQRLTCIISNLTDAQVETLESLYKIRELPFFLYDDAADFLTDKLWHCVVGSMRSAKSFNDANDVAFELYRLRSYA